MKVAYTSFKEFQKLTPCPDTVIISLTGDEDEITELHPAGWAKLLSAKFQVLRPEGPRGSFKPMDDQARKLATDIYPFIKDAKKVIVQCEYGEIRSAAVAQGLYHSLLSDGKLYEIQNGQWVESFPSRSDTFMGRTTGWIVSTIDDLHDPSLMSK